VADAVHLAYAQPRGRHPRAHAREQEEVIDGLPLFRIATPREAHVGAVESHRAEVVRRRQQQPPARPQHARQLTQGAARVGHVFDGLAGDDRVEARVRMFERLYVGDLPTDALQAAPRGERLAFGDGGFGEVGGDDFRGGVRVARGEPAGETAAAASNLQYPPARKVARGVEMIFDETMPRRRGLIVHVQARVPGLVCRLALYH
jgi:hypothetical protein